MTIREVLINIRERLQNAGIEDFEYESWAFLDWKLHIDRAEFYMNPNGAVKEELLAELESVLKQRAQRVPLQYLMGECEFMGYDSSKDNFSQSSLDDNNDEDDDNVSEEFLEGKELPSEDDNN